MPDSVGKRIQQLRRERGWTIRRLAVLARVPQSTLSQIEGGQRQGAKLTLATGKRLARALGVSLDFLAGVYTDDPDAEDAA